MIVVTSLLAVAAASCVLTWLFRRLLVKLAMLDIPNERSSHRLPVPRGGGVAIVFTVVATWLLAAIYGLVDRQEVAVMAAGGLLVAAVGLADDRSDVPAQWRLAVHLISAALLVAAAGGLTVISLGGISVELGWTGAILAVLYIVWLLNLYNFMDGIDGIAGLEAVTVVRNMLGATSGLKAAAGTIRGDFSSSRQMNLVHASDGPESAAREMALYFEESEIFACEPTLTPWLKAGDE